MGFAKLAAGGLVAAMLLLSGHAQAALLRLIYDGYLSADANTPDTLDGIALPYLTPFQVRAEFDSSQPNPVTIGFAWYQPLTFTMTIGGLTYQVSRVQDDPLYGQGVVIFDKTSPFSDVGDPVVKRHYGIGFFSVANPLHIGIIGDWSYANPEVTIATLGPTVFETFYGVGYNKGLMRLELGGIYHDLILNDAYEYNATDPSLIYTGRRVNNPPMCDRNYASCEGSYDNYAVLVAIPEPGSLAALAAALLLTGLLIPRHRPSV
jgi:hypothetical protein